MTIYSSAAFFAIILLSIITRTEPISDGSDSSSDVLKIPIEYLPLLMLAMIMLSIGLILALATSDSRTQVISDPVIRQQSIVTNIFGKPSVRTDRLRENSSAFESKLKIYCFLHKPVRLGKLYHFMVLTIIFLSVIILNIFDEGMANSGDPFATNLGYFKVITDSSIAVVLLFELGLRLWSCDVIPDYKGYRGKVLYWQTFLGARTLDVFGILIFSAYGINHAFIQHKSLDSNLRVAHLVQVLQSYRLLYRFLREIIETIVYQKNQLIIVLIFMSFTLLFGAFCVYLTEKDTNEKINTIFDAFWFTFVTFETIGYGDIYPETVLGKLVLIPLTAIGILFFALPGGLVGTGLALKIYDDERRADTCRVPAAKLIQSVWRCYASNKRSTTSQTWKLTKRSDNLQLTPEDRACIRFIRILIYQKNEQRFKLAMGLINDDFFKEKTTQELSRRLSLCENDLKNIGRNISIALEMRNKCSESLEKIKEIILRIKTQTESETKNETKDNSSQN